ncbi:hypothetical protein [Lentibacter algarum]|uniref:capsular polysaccharide export protein, LipB/KpsS family n=1 Tax=Lentibacter algarum TaxID=576131 RepID=UPI00339D8839
MTDKSIKKTFLFLLSDAPGFCEFFPMVGAELQRQGHDVIYASDSNHVTFLARHFHPTLRISELGDFATRRSETPFIINRGGLADWERVIHFFKPDAKAKAAFKFNMLYASAFPAQLYEKDAFDVVVSESPAGIYTASFFEFCKQKGIAWVGFEASRISGYWEFPDSDIAFETDDSELMSQVRDYVYRTSGSKISAPSYMNDKSLVSLTNVSLAARLMGIKKLKEYNLILHSTWAGNRTFFGNRPTKKYLENFRRLLLRKARMLVAKVFRAEHAPLPEQSVKTIFYPLHFHPEASTSMAAAQFLDEYDMLFFLATQVDGDTSMFVKEHPSMAGLRSAAQARALAALPTVTLVEPSVKSVELIDRCDLILALTSTAALEALMRGKPVVALGDVFFNSHRNCRFARSKSEALEMIAEYFNGRWATELDGIEDYNTTFIKSHLRGALRFELGFYDADEFHEKAPLLAKELARARYDVHG